jgi:anthranilate phosphoribosyltransferase
MTNSSRVSHVAAGNDLSREEMAETIDQIMRGNWSDEELAGLLTALHEKGETFLEIAGAAEALRQHMRRIHSRHDRLLDTCGTGGDRSGTFNISTAAAIVTAAAGVPVAKHGNRSITSRTGSADVLAELGVNIEASVEQAERCLDQLGICFCFAPLMHPSMRHVGAVRRRLGIRTIFNLLGPLCNPANAATQLLGVPRQELRGLLAAALKELGTQRSVVVCGEDQLDEVTLGGTTFCTLAEPNSCRDFCWQPADFGLSKTTERLSLLAGSPAESAAIIRRTLQNEAGPPREIVILNAAAALWTAEYAPELTACTTAAQEAIASGAAQETLQRLVEVSHAVS